MEGYKYLIKTTSHKRRDRRTLHDENDMSSREFRPCIQIREHALSEFLG